VCVCIVCFVSCCDGPEQSQGRRKAPRIAASLLGVVVAAESQEPKATTLTPGRRRAGHPTKDQRLTLNELSTSTSSTKASKPPIPVVVAADRSTLCRRLLNGLGQFLFYVYYVFYVSVHKKACIHAQHPELARSTWSGLDLIPVNPGWTGLDWTGLGWAGLGQFCLVIDGAAYTCTCTCICTCTEIK
jgi:hypothetical protein